MPANAWTSLGRRWAVLVGVLVVGVPVYVAPRVLAVPVGVTPGLPVVCVEGSSAESSVPESTTVAPSTTTVASSSTVVSVTTTAAPSTTTTVAPSTSVVSSDVEVAVVVQDVVVDESSTTSAPSTTVPQTSTTTTVAPPTTSAPVSSSTTVVSTTTTVPATTVSPVTTTTAPASTTTVTTTAPVSGGVSGGVVCPGVVLGVVAEPGINEVVLSWVAPVNAESAGVTSFVVDVVSEARLETVDTSVTSVTVGGLPNGVEARFVVYAVGPRGAGPGSVEVRATPSTGVEGVVAGLIVKPKAPTVVGESLVVDGPLGVSASFAVVDEVSSDAVLVELDQAVSVAEAEDIADDLEAAGVVEWAEPDQFLFTATTVQPVSVPSDSEWSESQWNLWGEFGVGVADGAESMTDVWASGTGEGVTVAVVDTGVTSHPDLDSRLVAGFDFVSNPERLAAARDEGGSPVPFDGDYVDTTTFGALGRDSDPSDPGDWRGVTPIRGSSWHGTQIAGVIAAQANNQQGIVGVAPGATIQPIRALSWRGGLLSDIAAAITWASGGEIDGVPANATPSQVINLSFAVETQCPTSLQSAIDTALANGSVVVAAAGNANANVSGFAPANCDGVIAVGASTRDGVRASYSNWGAGIDISAPGGSSQGGVLTTSNTGATTPAAASYGNDEGTSIAAAHVAGAAAVVWSRDRTQTAASVVERLTGQDYATQFSGGTCDTDTTKTCGAGILSLAQIAMVRQGATDYAMTFTRTGNSAGSLPRQHLLLPFPVSLGM